MDKSGGTKTETTISLKCDQLLFHAVCSISCFVVCSVASDDLQLFKGLWKERLKTQFILSHI